MKRAYDFCDADYTRWLEIHHPDKVPSEHNSLTSQEPALLIFSSPCVNIIPPLVASSTPDHAYGSVAQHFSDICHLEANEILDTVFPLLSANPMLPPTPVAPLQHAPLSQPSKRHPPTPVALLQHAPPTQILKRFVPPTQSSRLLPLSLPTQLNVLLFLGFLLLCKYHPLRMYIQVMLKLSLELKFWPCWRNRQLKRKERLRKGTT